MARNYKILPDHTIARQLGIEIDLTDQASTFAGFEKALAAS